MMKVSDKDKLLINTLIKRAKSVLKNAYAPYSKYKVSAALLTSAGKVFIGTNVENSSYGLTVCAERNAVFSAVSAGFKEFKMIAVVVEDGEAAVPCGACLQVLSEFCDKNFLIISYSCENNKTSVYKLGELLPKSFIFKK